MTNGEAINWIINLTADIGKAENQHLWHYEQALTEIRGMFESAPRWIPCSERLPEERSDWKNVTVIDEIDDTSYIYTSVGFYLSDGCWIVDNEPMDDDSSIRVLAWASMPEPYKPPKEDM